MREQFIPGSVENEFEANFAHEVNVKSEQPNIETVEKIEPAEAISAEKSLIDRFKGKAGKAAKVLTILTAMAMPAANISEAQAAENNQEKTKIEFTEDQRQSAFDFINTLRNMPDNPRAVSPSHNETLKKRAAVVLVDNYARNNVEAKAGMTINDQKDIARKRLRQVFSEMKDLSEMEIKFLKSVL